ncbi:MAG TPA: tRNA (adenosine(37)-N6)-threonylcarbamoyltransferase complex dimerization subunit type 1 TsaB [Candidatus Acidoferrum sp.]|nr:tRNA (adenosine(37)-N6)-threonylcarbamoyltransferase complex dimerization subunit type 1 TsaB [Candidatus Acidoferrum sp.]
MCFLIDWPVNCPIMVQMLLLAADTSSPSGSVAILREDSVVGLIHTVSDEPYSSRLFRHIDFLLRDLSLELKDFDLFAVASGPGSFTGLRVGLTAAKAWSEAFNLPVAGVSVLEAVASEAGAGPSLRIPVVDARRQEVYYALFDGNGNQQALAGNECVAAMDELVADVRSRAGGRRITFVASCPELLASVAESFGRETAEYELVSSALAPSIGRIAMSLARAGHLADSLTLDANYVRRSDAELKWKGQ